MNENNAENIKRIATFCSYAPVEIIDAAGFRPTRILRYGKSTNRAISYFPACVCSFCSDCLDTMFSSLSNYAGMVFINSCYAMNAFFEEKKKYIRDKPVFLVDTPTEYFLHAEEHLFSVLKNFRTSLEESYNVRITNEKLRASIKKYNRLRNRKTEIERLIIQQKLNLTANERMLLNEKLNTDADEFIRYAEVLIGNAKNIDRNRKKLPRIMICESIYAPVNLTGMVEELGGNVVLCDNCSCSRAVNSNIDETIDPMEAIVQKYINKPPCGRHTQFNKKMQEFQQNVDDYKVDGVIFSAMKFCPDQNYSALNLAEVLKSRDIPFLFLNVDYMGTSLKQVRARIEGFLERLKV